MQIMVKAQMKIQQTAFMLIALTLFFILVALFFIGFKISGLKEDVEALEEKQAKLLVSKIAASPEFTCGESYGIRNENCVDADKVLMLIQEKEKYKKFWGVDDIKIRKIYPKLPEDVVCTMANYPNCNLINILEEEVVGTYVSNFITLCRKEVEGNKFYDKCELAILMASYGKE